MAHKPFGKDDSKESSFYFPGMGTTIQRRCYRRCFLTVSAAAVVFLSACAYKSGYNGERMAVDGGGGKLVYCGAPSTPAPEIKGRIGLYAGELGASGLFRNPVGMEDSIRSFGRCYFVPADAWELPADVTDLHASRFRVTQHQPFGNVIRVNGKPYTTDTTWCQRLEISFRAQSREEVKIPAPIFNGPEPYFDGPVLAWFKDLCKGD